MGAMMSQRKSGTHEKQFGEKTTIVMIASRERPKTAPRSRSKRAKCFKYAKGHYCEIFYQIYSAKKVPDGPFFPNWKHQKAQFSKKRIFLQKLHSAEKFSPRLFRKVSSVR